ncbi:aldehyde dehydrogenase (NADP(+)) [Paracoccus spongiarum]|uniref:Aldehyde dehydrogenase (NADP(+)) n=1 Tax=Paracoccus spongiarum TaxID=3064387 RepID=A0ABT9J7I9_9RHOB|nr:aldehyde dehydrogenase (NADP(+)) [Paracoccus sp. 2205BS29-5]MDP5305768.1 aldehyde dehydrogenase (NADP(+)) [Paracoccus sp. 2205BS29-5]
MTKGRHLIAGDWVAEGEIFDNATVDGVADRFHAGSPDLVDRAVVAAEAAFVPYAALSRARRARFLRRIADEIEARGARITQIATRETGLPAARLEGERGRTTGQLRLFADHIEAGEYLDRRHDPALPHRAPLPRPDLRLMQRPVGPVAVFGASNFPLAFSVAGGDTASALAAGCPVVVKGHEAHPGTSEIVAEAIAAAISAEGLHPGIFSMVHGGSQAVGAALVQHPLIKAAGFTGSLRGGRALFDLCAARPEPIPFFGELGSVNPMFLLPGAMATRAKAIAEGWAASLTLGAGQFCTNPGLAIAVEGDAADAFAARAAEALGTVPPQVMLTDGIAKAFRTGRDRAASTAGVGVLLSTSCNGRNASPMLLRTTGDALRADPQLMHEVFGPLGIFATVHDLDEMVALATCLDGQLTATMHIDDADTEAAAQLLPVLERKAGRILANGFPTGVEVADAMVHGGPYPASTNFGATSVGTMAIRRWLRPVCYQNLPKDLLPEDLRV